MIKSGHAVCDPTLFAFIEEGSKAPDTVNPSLWRQAQLARKGGLFKVVDRIYQVRNHDISNLTIIEGDSGLILMDPLISAETARAALDLYYAHRPHKPVIAVLHSHSHVDHYGGIKGVVEEADVKAGKVQIIAPVGFLEAAVAENILAGNVMTRRALYQYGALMPSDAKGQVGLGLGTGISTGTVTLIAPTQTITETGQKMVIDGLTFEFMLAPDTEAPGGDALVHRGARRADRGGELLPHAAQHLHPARRADPRPAGVVAVPQRDDRALGRTRPR